MNREELLRTHIRDKKRGTIIEVRPYRLKIVKGVRVFQKDGQSYYEDGTPVDNSWELREAKEQAEAAANKLKAVEARLDAQTEKTSSLKEKKDEQSSATVASNGLQRKGKN